MTRSFPVEVHRQPTLAQLHFGRKISQLNLLEFMIKIKERKEGALWVTLCLQCAWPAVVCSKILWCPPMETVPQWEWERFIQNRMYPLEPEIFICIDLHLPFYLYDLAFSKHLCVYSLNMPVLCLSCIHHYASKHKSHRCKYLLIINI